MTYREYLKSPEWQSVRDARKRMDEFRCVCCGSAAELNVHHVRYPQDWFSTGTGDLVTLCRKCHALVHRMGEWTGSKHPEKLVNGKPVRDMAEWLRSPRVKDEFARMLAVRCWEDNRFSTADVSRYAHSVTDVFNRTYGCGAFAPVAETMVLLSFVKDCFIANGSPTFNSERRRRKAKAKTKIR